MTETTDDFRQRFAPKGNNFARGKALGEDQSKPGNYNSYSKKNMEPSDYRGGGTSKGHRDSPAGDSDRYFHRHDDYQKSREERLKEWEKQREQKGKEYDHRKEAEENERKKDEYKKRDDEKKGERRESEDRWRESDRDRRRDGDKHKDEKDKERDRDRDRKRSPDRLVLHFFLDCSHDLHPQLRLYFLHHCYCLKIQHVFFSTSRQLRLNN